MDDCIAEMERKLKLTEKESFGVFISKDDTIGAVKDENLCHVGKILANRFFGGDLMFEAMKKAWKVRGSFRFQGGRDNIFFFQFENRLDLLQAKCGGPWHFDQNILVLEHFNGNLTPEEYKFNITHAWM